MKKYRDNCCIAIVWVPNIPSIHTVLQTCGIRHCQSHMQSFQYTSFFYLAIENSVGKYQLLLSDNYFLSLKTRNFVFILASKLWFHVVSLWSLPLAIALSGPPCFFSDYRKNVTMINNCRSVQCSQIFALGTKTHSYVSHKFNCSLRKLIMFQDRFSESIYELQDCW